jgi:hypothetical protein
VDLQGLKNELARLRESAFAATATVSPAIYETAEPSPDDDETIETVGRYRLAP